MNLDLKDIGSKVQPALRFMRRYVTFFFVIAMLGIFSFMVFRINQFNSQTPSDEAVAERLQTVQRPRLDQSVIDRIQQLQDQNIEVQTLFNEARNNPFNE